MTIASVQQQPSGLYVVTDSEGQKHATKSPWLASLADRYRETGVDVELFSASGWWYRELWSIREAGVKDEEKPCAWCRDYNPDDPNHRGKSTGMCPACAKALMDQCDADLTKKVSLR